MTSFFKVVGSLVLLSAIGFVAWGVKEWLSISDVTIAIILVYVVYLYAGYENFKLRDELNDLKADFEFYKEESEAEIARLDRRVKVLFDEIDILHPDGPDRYWKYLGLDALGAKDTDQNET